MNKFRKYIFKQYFNPDFLGIFINPFFIARFFLRKNIKKLSVQMEGNMLDIGCGTKPYKKLFNVISYIGMEIESTQYADTKTDIDVYYDGKVFPFDSHSFDSALSNQVLEHVFNPDEFLSEINRILKPNGLLLLTVPFVWDEHEQPYDYARYSSFGLKHLLENNNFEIVHHIKSVSNIAVIFQLINGYIYKKTNKIRIIRVVATILLCSTFNILGLLFALILPNNNDLYLDNVVLAKKKH